MDLSRSLVAVGALAPGARFFKDNTGSPGGVFVVAVPADGNIVVADGKIVCVRLEGADKGVALAFTGDTMVYPFV